MWHADYKPRVTEGSWEIKPGAAGGDQAGEERGIWVLPLGPHRGLSKKKARGGLTS